MPNWCDCELVVTGPAKDLERFKEKAAVPNLRYADDEPTVLSEEAFIPYPVKYRALDDQARAWDRDNYVDGDRMKMLKPGVNYSDRPRDGFNSGGYAWCCANWGTKWGFRRPEIVDESSPDRVFYHFETAWSPPLPLILKMSEMFPTLTFNLQYYERGRQFQGKLVARGGEQVEHTQSKYVGPRGG